MGVHADSSADLFDNSKDETIVELLTRIWGSAIGVVSTAFIADATQLLLQAILVLVHSMDLLFIRRLMVSRTTLGQTTLEPMSLVLSNFSQAPVLTREKATIPSLLMQLYRISEQDFHESCFEHDKSSWYLLHFQPSNLLDRNAYTDYLNTMTNDPSGNKKPALD